MDEIVFIDSDEIINIINILLSWNKLCYLKMWLTHIYKN